MKLCLKTSAVALLASTFLVAPASASDLFDAPSGDYAQAAKSINWGGFYIGGQVGYGNSNHHLKGQGFKEVPCDTPKQEEACYEAIDGASGFIDGLNAKGFFGGGTVGFDVQKNHLLFGVFGDYNISNGEATTSNVDGTDTQYSIEEGDSWLAAARLGYLFGQEKRALLYVLGGYGQTDYTFEGQIVSLDPQVKKDVTFSGFIAGAGGEYALTNNVFLGIEWQHFFGGEKTLFDGRSLDDAPLVHVTDEVDPDKVMAKVKIKLNSDVFGD